VQEERQRRYSRRSKKSKEISKRLPPTSKNCPKSLNSCRSSLLNVSRWRRASKTQCRYTKFLKSFITNLLKRISRRNGLSLVVLKKS